jgi:peptidoglycan hydrolase-like protein with peptidoglycan-binding domain
MSGIDGLNGSRLRGLEGAGAAEAIATGGPDVDEAPAAPVARGSAGPTPRSGGFAALRLADDLNRQLDGTASARTQAPFNAETIGEVKLGDRDNAGVTTLQNALNVWRDRKGEKAMRVDGDFGGGTKGMVEHFQRSNGLPVTGKADRATWRALAGMIEAKKTIVEERPTRGAAPFEAAKMPKLEKGVDNKEAVKQLQESLNGWRATRNLAPIPTTGNFGTQTKEAVEQFQRATGLTNDGVAGKDVWEKLALTHTRDLTSTRAPVELEVPWISQYDDTGRVERPGDKACFRATAAMTSEYKANKGIQAEQLGLHERIDVSRSENTTGDVISTAENAAAARAYIDRALDAGLPVTVGVSYKAGSDYNKNPVTDHFVVVTGRGKDAQGRDYYTFKDPSTTHADKAVGKFTVDAQGKLDKEGANSGLLVNQHFEVSEVRTWKEVF